MDFGHVWDFSCKSLEIASYLVNSNIHFSLHITNQNKEKQQLSMHG